MPRGPNAQSKAQNSAECSSFEAALRRDLATAPVISYDSTIGGWPKRAVDLALTVLAAPVWGPALLIAAGWSKLRHPAPVFFAEDRVGYGGKDFRCYRLRLDPPTAVIERLRPAGAPEQPEPANDWSVFAARAENRRAKWRRAFERLPQLINVLRGEMSLVGPAPLAQDDLEPLKTAKRYYLSARPGVVGVSAIADADDEEASHYKLYALNWSLGADALILWEAVRGMKDRGELWRPSFKIKRPRSAEAPVRRRTRAAG